MCVSLAGVFGLLNEDTLALLFSRRLLVVLDNGAQAPPAGSSLARHI
jgi:hypothetical protein